MSEGIVVNSGDEVVRRQNENECEDIDVEKMGEELSSSSSINIGDATLMNPNDGEDGDVISEDDADDLDPGGSGAGVRIPGDIQAEPRFVSRFSQRLNSLYNDENPRFEKFESICSDLIICLKK